MKIHEYQGKEIFRSFNIPVPIGYAVNKLDDVEKVIKKVQNESKKDAVVVKAQIHAGGRGKGGGVKFSSGLSTAVNNANKIFGMNLVTHQTGESGQKVRKILIEEASNISKEFYCAITLDRSLGQFVFMVSTEGGMEIEKVAEETPEKIVKVWIDPLIGMKSFHARKLAFGLQLSGSAYKEAVNLFLNLFKCFIRTDASLAEINPLVLTNDNKIIALDCNCLLYTSPSPRDISGSRMPSSA